MGVSQRELPWWQLAMEGEVHSETCRSPSRERFTGAAGHGGGQEGPGRGAEALQQGAGRRRERVVGLEPLSLQAHGRVDQPGADFGITKKNCLKDQSH